METPPDAESPITFEVEYHRFTKALRNLDFKGQGTLEISADGDRFTFRGKRASLIGTSHELILETDQISNVHQKGDTITFVPTKGDSASKKKPFVLYCRTASTASQIVEFLPSTQTDGHQSEIKRLELLDTVCPPIPTQTSPTILIAAANALIFVLIATIGGAGWIDPLLEPYIKYGANNGAFTTQGEWWRLFTSMFLHFGIVHVLLNIWVMKDVGQLLERLIGRTHFLVTYCGTGLLASLSSIFWYGDGVWSAGASGAVFGIYGTLLALSVRDKQNLPLSLFAPIRKSAIVFIGYNLFFGLTQEGIDNAAHIGGFLSGFAIGNLISTPLDAPRRSETLSRKLKFAIPLIAAVLSIGIIASPRFDYNPYEEMELYENWNQFAEREGDYLRVNNTILDTAENSPEDRDKAITALQKNLIPFYSEWAQTFGNSQYKANSSTERSRSLLEEYSQLRTRSYQTFVHYLKMPNEETSDKYWKLVEQADAKIEALDQLAE